jgi:hypothetical protein
MRGGGGVAHNGADSDSPVTRRSSLVLELQCTTFSAISTYAERGTRQTQPRDLGGGSGDGEGTTAGDAGGAGRRAARGAAIRGKN